MIQSVLRVHQNNQEEHACIPGKKARSRKRCRVVAYRISQKTPNPRPKDDGNAPCTCSYSTPCRRMGPLVSVTDFACRGVALRLELAQLTSTSTLKHIAVASLTRVRDRCSLPIPWRQCHAVHCWISFWYCLFYQKRARQISNDH